MRGGAAGEEGANAAGEEKAGESIPGVLSEVELAMSSFKEILGENLLVVDNAKKGTTKEVYVYVCIYGRGRSRSSSSSNRTTRGRCGVVGGGAVPTARWY